MDPYQNGITDCFLVFSRCKAAWLHLLTVTENTENFYKELDSFMSRSCDCLPAEAHISKQSAASLQTEHSIYFHTGITVSLGRILFYIERVT